MELKVIPTPLAAPWYAEGLQFTCAQCGNCCSGGPGYVWISDIEIDRLAAHLKLPRPEVVERYCRLIGSRHSLNETRNAQGFYDCVFLRHQNVTGKGEQVVHSKRVCAIYEVRPLQCRTWPFWDGNLAGRQAWDRAAGRCPGINRGQRHSPAHIEAMRDARDWPTARK